MRPIRLEFAGLQSYREKQELDFTQLLDGGLFGIFGPTGAGKSTVLDAITLALYGRVGRAERGTIGIMNHAENRLYVKFTFGLGPETYRVERAYKREKDTPSIRSEYARLVRVRTADGALPGDAPAGDEVLADKDREVTQRVIDLLGLQVEDFTRAVVLPQGQFAEFLTLTGAERTKMLQRIFALEQYGDKLHQRLRQRLEAVRGQLIAVESEQAGLGDASAEAVSAAEQRLGIAAALLTTAEEELGRVEAEFRSWERVWNLQQELREVEERLAAWQGQVTEAQAWRQELLAARRADGVRPHLEARDQAAAQAAQSAARLAEAEQALAAATASLDAAVEAHEAARTRRANEFPALTRRQRDLQRAAELEGALAEARGKAADLAARVAKGQGLLAQVSAELAAGTEHRQTLLAREARLREQIAALDVSAELRERVSQAVRSLDRLREAQVRLTEAERRLRQREDEMRKAGRLAEQGRALQVEAERRLREIEQTVAQLEAEPPASDDDLRAEEAWLSRVAEQIRTLSVLLEQAARRREEYEARAGEAARLQQEADRAAAAEVQRRQELDAARAAREAARAAVAEARRQAHAAALVSELKEGAPCPVCGSREHPHPASPEAAADLQAREAELEQAEARLREVELALERAAQQRIANGQQAAAAAGRAAEAEAALQQAEARVAELQEQLPAAWRGLPPAQLQAALEREAAGHRERRARFEAWRDELTTWQAKRQEQADRLSRAAAEAADRMARSDLAQRAVEEAHGEVEALARSLAERQAEFDAARGDMTPESVEETQRRIAEADRRVAGLRKQLEALRSEQEEQERTLEELRRREQEYTKLLHQREVELAEARQRLSEIESEWRRLSGGQPAAPQLAAVEAQLRRLEEDEASAAERRDQAERAHRQAESALAAARREAELAAQRDAETAAALASALEAAGFPDGQAARSALRSAQRQAELEALIQAHEQEGVRLQSRQGELRDQLAGRSLTEAEWQGWSARLEQARTAVEERREERARAQQVLADLLAKQQRWQELEERRTALSTQVNYLEELRKVLQGNAFVDFLAAEQMRRVAADASQQLGQLTRDRYALVTEPGGGFLIRDDANGGVCRAVTSLSGGETFLASLSLALALSKQIQLRGRYPLEFFFLDEGFGTLDPELLDVVISALEGLRGQNLKVGVISHVAELRARLQRRVIVEPAEPGGRGSRLRLERA
ncbi:MAG: AAA family ATPase [Symbiobacterium sp.]|uniref:AAA family ATPase n=1 Tax=Symbiobacterium sp. TaxID=1971213 RepID=UPI00346490A9